MQTYKALMLFSVSAAILSGCATTKQTTLRFHEQVSSALPESHVLPVQIPGTGLKLTVNPAPTLSERDVQAAEIYKTAGGAAVLLRFDPHGVFALDEMTTRTRGQYIVIFLNEKPVAAWMVDRRLTNGQFLLEGDFSDEQAQQTVDALNQASKKRK
jgi:preprotein translocase subunit SecD